MEGDAGASQLNPTDADQTLTDASDADACSAAAPEPGQASDPESPDTQRGPSRLGRGWLAGITAVLLLAAGGLAAGGYCAVRSHQESQAVARNDAAAIQAAKECVAATQAPDTHTMAASEQKIIDCGTDEFRSQALLYGSVLVQAYQAA
ncbi:MAG: Mce protein, partial [Mycobacteriaceae bacterium]|nr:Mce protein [Mycobacteriaceae bacterium]